MKALVLLACLLVAVVTTSSGRCVAAEARSPAYPYPAYAEGRLDPQPFGWPLTAEEHAYVQIPEFERKPGKDVQKHRPDMWPVVPTASRWRKAPEENIWINHHSKAIEQARAAGDTLDVLLVGDSITQGWGGSPIDNVPFNQAWQKRFGRYRTVNAGIGGDRTEGVLWRLEHGLLDGVTPKAVVLMIGVNNAPHVAANGVPPEAVAQGIKLCVDNVRLKAPAAHVVVVKVVPAFAPDSAVHRGILATNAALDALDLPKDDHVQVVDAGKGFYAADGTLNTAAYSDGHLHLSPVGYGLLAEALAPALSKVLGDDGT
ncbi:MAG: GDSL-type esterase/lipase family protein [Planctomycetia bacterium]